MARFMAVDHRDPRITYTGHWTVLPSAHSTIEQNATATFDFDGSALSIAGSAGMVNVATSPVSFMLDGQDNTSLAFNSERPHILYSSPTLQQGKHTLFLTLLTNTSFLSIESVQITVADIGTKSEHIVWTKPNIAAIICGAVIAFAIVTTLIALFIRHHLRKRPTILHSTGPLRVALPTTKEAFTSRNYSTYGLIFLPYDPGTPDIFTPLPPRRSRTRLKRHNPTFSPLTTLVER